MKTISLLVILNVTLWSTIRRKDLKRNFKISIVWVFLATAKWYIMNLNLGNIALNIKHGHFMWSPCHRLEVKTQT